MERLKHECGVALIRLMKPIEYYERKYGTRRYGLDKLYLMMEKQHNRGQEGAGVACVNMDAPVGTEYMYRERAEGTNAITEVFKRMDDSFVGQLYMGHLRYSTTGKSGLTYVHPFLRRNNWRAKNLCLCGNFNMTNIDEVFALLTGQGQSPRIYGDSYITLELMGHRLDREVERLFVEAKGKGLEGQAITQYIEDRISMENVLKTTMPHFDGGYVMCGLTGSGEMFAVRDPWGIRPAYYYWDDEIVALASERPVLQTTFNLDADGIKELDGGEALVIHRNGEVSLRQVIPSQGNHRCSFERIYFSRGSAPDIYQERKRLGEQLTMPILKAIHGDLENTVFSYIPNTAEVAFYGMTDGFRRLNHRIRVEKVVWKDVKLRTFITEGAERNDLAAHVYDVTYGSIRPNEDNLVIIDDSIVRGTTLKESIFQILDRLHPKKIVMVSSSPQIRYPDYYGIDMSRLDELCAFRAAMSLALERGMRQLIDDTYQACLAHPTAGNHVRVIYEPFSVEEINRRMVDMLRPQGMRTPIDLVFQSIEGLHKACPDHAGDWYFTGYYPTDGGVRMVNRAFVDYVENVMGKNG
ncbi:MAG: amidophosphoribosyltransferase [Prevotella sp.]|nr:amidophosphoribosyltransferase [Prevotella sp.]